MLNKIAKRGKSQSTKRKYLRMPPIIITVSFEARLKHGHFSTIKLVCYYCLL